MLCWARLSLCVSSFPRGEEPLGQPWPSLERALQTVDLEQINPDSGHWAHCTNLFDRDRLGEVAWLIDVESPEPGNSVCEELERNDCK